MPDADEGALVPSGKGHQPEWLLAESYRREADELVKRYLPLVDPLQAMFGPRTEVVLHDLSKMPGSVVAIANSLTGRAVGAPSTNLGLIVMASEERPTQLIGYRTEMAGGIVCRSSTVFLYGSAPHPLVALCVNTDVREIISAKAVLESMVGTWSPLEPTSEVFYDNVESLSEDVLRRSIKSVGIPVEDMTKKQKISVVAELERRGFFIIREAADLAAAALGVTRYTIYNYLNEVR
jgi:predicted transcriptional regulator YheO